jgi:NADH:ubiquinone oxidoreductase subunit
MGLLKSLFTWWDGPTIGTRWMTRRHGVEVGRDLEGNIYYASKAGDRRWVIYNGDNEASRVPPEWHLWLHKTIDTPPSKAPPSVKSWEKPWVPNTTGGADAHAPSGALQRGGRRARATGDYEAWTPD